MSKSGWIALLCLWIMAVGAVGAERGVVMVKDTFGRQTALYTGSYALLIGISDYTTWPDLESIPGELRQVERLLRANGFHVVKHPDLNGQQLRDAFQDFINEYGYDPDNRLLFYFSGHGHTWVDGGQGYLVPRDAPRPATEQGFPGAPFLRKSLHMSQILAWSRQMTARHALFMFDSCFSGAVFKTRALPERPPNIGRATALKVRQFITAGSAGEAAPAKSVFTPAFVDALEYRWGDLNRDGYVTGMELGLYLEGQVPLHARQSPQFGKHPDYELSRGDFVFVLGGQQPPPAQTARLTVRSNVYGDTLYIGGQALGPTGPQIHELAPGTYTVRVEKPGYGSWEQTLTLTAGEGETVRAELSRAPPRPTPPPVTASRPPAVRTWTEPKTGITFVWVPGGCFEMGSPEDEQGRVSDEGRHRVCVEGFWLGRHEVTNAQYRRFREQHDSGQYEAQSLNGDEQPVLEVSWEDAVAYAQWASEQTGQPFRLPTEAEWEYAARAETQTSRYWGDDVNEACRYANVHDETSERVNKFSFEPHRCDDGYAVTAPVGGFEPNGFGLYDMLGNVREWTCSGYVEDYGNEEKRCAGEADRRVHRGGSWYDFPRGVRAATRTGGTPEYRNNDLGFRLARTP